MIDFHSHILPGVDDGSHDVEESLKLLDASAEQAVDIILATPHFYAQMTSPEKFFKRRNEAAKNLSNFVRPYHPEIVLGAEVYYFEGIHRSDAIKDFRIGDTSLLLLEMPFSRWTDHIIREVLSLNSEKDITVVLAHIERYFKYQKKGLVDELIKQGILIQSNAEFLISRKTRKRALKMLLSGQIHFIGSDCHNNSSRPQNIGRAFDIIGEEGKKIIQNNSVKYGILRI